MATEAPTMSTNGDGELSAAQKLMQKHAHDEVHKVTVEDVPDEDDIKHGEPPKVASILESPEDVAAAAPSWAQPVSTKAAGKQKATEQPVKAATLDTQSHELFPELGAPKAQNGTSAPSIWSAMKPAVANGSTGGTPRTATPTSGAATPTGPAVARGLPNMSMPGRHTERIQLAPSQLMPRQQMKKPLADILKDVNKKSKATVTMTTGQGGTLWLTAIGPVDACRQALKDLVEQIGSRQSVRVPIPRAARPFIIGKQGATIKALQEKSGARIQMPKEDGNGSIEDDDDGTVDVIVEGNALSAEMARIDIQKIADEKAATVTHKLRGIPSEFYPFIAGPRNERIQALEDGRDVRVHVPSNIRPGQVPQFAAIGQPPNFSPAPPDLPITVSGDRHAVQDIRAAIERQAQELRRQLTAEQFPINRGRHQFIVGDRGIPSHQFLADTGCAIILPSDDDDETITIIGPADQVSAGVERAMDLASSMHSTSLDLSRHLRNVQGGAAAHARNLVRYLQQRREIERLERMHNAHIVTPIASEGVAPWELYSREGKNALRAQSEIMNILNGLPPSRMATMDVDPFFHQHLRKDVLPKVQQDYGVHTIIPREESSSPVLLVFEGPSGMEADYQVPRTQPSTVEQQQFQEALTSARQYIANIIGQQEEIISRSIDVPEKFHDKLKRFIKNEQQDRSIEQIPVRVTSNRSIVTMRGPKPAVESLLQKVEAFVAQAIADEKERGFTMSFDFPQKHANQLIGKGGSNIKELRERFDVEIQVDNGKVELKGPKAKCEAAKSHIISQGKQWADDTTHTLKVEPKYHGDLIGAQGSQINKLQTRYKVQIHFPRSVRPAKDDQSVADGSDAGQKAPRRQQAEDEVVVRGPSKGADEARDEILSLLQYLKDNSYSATVSVKQNQIPSLIGQGGKGMEELRQLTGAKIDIPRSRDATDVEIQIKGTKAQVAQAKKLIEEKRDVFNQTVAKTLDVEKKHHRALIGPGGSTVRDIIIKAGGSGDQRQLSRIVQFPKSESEGNQIKIEGNKDVVDKIIAIMEEIVAKRENEVTESIDVPTEKHRALIGRGGETRREIESRFQVNIDIPRQGSGQTGVKITGPVEKVAEAKEHIANLVKEEEGETIQVPCGLHHSISDNGMFFRRLKQDHQVNVDHAGHKVPAKPTTSSNARANGGALPLITDDQSAVADAHSWNVVSVADSEDGEIPWVLRGSPENVAKAKARLQTALEQARKQTSTGYLILPDPRTYRFVIGQGGSKVNNIRKQTGCKVTVPKDQARDEAIEIAGSAEGVEKAREMILEAVKEGLSNGSRQ